MFPAGYNNAYEIIQIPGYVVIVYEMIHDTRIIPLDGRPHPARTSGCGMGDSRGRWEGNTLVVETTNFNDKAHRDERSVGACSRGSAQRGLHVVERFTRVGET